MLPSAGSPTEHGSSCGIPTSPRNSMLVVLRSGVSEYLSLCHCPALTKHAHSGCSARCSTSKLCH